MGAPTGKTPPVAAGVRPASPEVGQEPEGPPTSQDVNEALVEHDFSRLGLVSPKI